MEFGDAKLVYRLNHKDDKVWEELFNSYYESLCNHAYRILLDESVTEDIVQEVFVKLWDGRAVFENEKALTVYLYRSVTNNALKYLRDRDVEEARLKLWSEVEQEMTEEDFSSVVREEVLRKLRELIELLPEERKKIILMSMEGMSGEEIATQFTVKQQKYRAYKFIKEQLGSYWSVAMIFFL